MSPYNAEPSAACAAPYTTLVIDDHPLYRNALALQLATAAPSATVVEAASVDEALRLAAKLPAPRLVLLDWHLPGVSGVAAVQALRAALPGCPLVVVSASEDRREADAALRTGVAAFVSKGTPTPELLGLLGAVLAGAAPAPRWLANVGPSEAARPEDPAALNLTPRQQDVLYLLCQGHANKEIALRLGLEETTVKMHISALFRALAVQSRSQAMLTARRLGLDGAASASG